MSVFILKPEEYQVVGFYVPAQRIPTVHYGVEATGPVSVFLVDRQNLRLFEAGQSYEYSGKRKRKQHDEEIRLERPGHWSLVVWNEDDEEDVGVNVEIAVSRAPR